MESTSPSHIQRADWLLAEKALLLIGLTKISLTKSGFDHPSQIESPQRLRALWPYATLDSVAGVRAFHSVLAL
jgi:hypothetical protein